MEKDQGEKKRGSLEAVTIPRPHNRWQPLRKLRGVWSGQIVLFIQQTVAVRLL